MSDETNGEIALSELQAFPGGRASPDSLSAGRLRKRTGPAITLKEINMLCWGLFVALLLAPTCLVVKEHIQSGQFLKQVPERDFIYFYSMGRILNEYPAGQLYDYELQKKIAMEIHPLQKRVYGPNPYPPFVGVLFQPFALMPFSTAYLLWLSVSFVLYVAGLALLAGRLFPNDPLVRSLIFCFALSFFPFIWIMIGGQPSSIGFFAMALAFRKEDLQRPVQSGLALSLCLYKPTLLVLFLPMLLVTRRYRTLIGFSVGAIVLALFTTLMAGARVWSGYVHLLFSFGSAAVRTHGYKELDGYMDLSSFSSLIPGGRSWPGGAILVGCAGFAGFWLCRSWFKSVKAGKPANTLVWAATLTWTLVLNIYVPIYDSLLVVLSVIATARVLKDLPGHGLNRPFTLIWLMIFASSWITVNIAESTGIQIVTVLVAALGIFQLFALRRTASSGDRQPV